MAKKSAGLGRGLGDLLEDNTLEIRRGQGAVIRKGESSVISAPSPASNARIPKPLYEESHKNKSLKANFKNFNR